MHYDQEIMFNNCLSFQEINEGIEVTEADLLEAWRRAKKESGYFTPTPPTPNLKKYKIIVQEIATSEFTIEAESEDEAVKLAREESYNPENFEGSELKSCDFNLYDISEV